MSSSTPVSEPVFAYSYMFGHTSRSLYPLPHPPSMYCSALAFLSSSLFCLSARTGSLEQELAGSLVACCVEGKANSETHKHRKRCFPHPGPVSVSVFLLGLSESGSVSTSLTTCAFFSVFRSPSRFVILSPPLPVTTHLVMQLHSTPAC